MKGYLKKGLIIITELQSDPVQEMAKETVITKISPEIEQVLKKTEEMEANLKEFVEKEVEQTILKITSKSTKDLTLPSVYKELLPLASEWHIIGALLELPTGKLKEIEADYQKVSHRLREMIRIWLTRIDPDPSWEQLVEKLKVINQSIAAEIFQKYCT